MLNRSQTTFFQIFYELLLYFQVILKSMRVADDTLEGISECEWVKALPWITVHPMPGEVSAIWAIERQCTRCENVLNAVNCRLAGADKAIS